MRPPRTAGSLVEFGLPYAADAAITRHLAHFCIVTGQPTHVLFNGGMLRAKLVRERILEMMNDGWRGPSHRWSQTTHAPVPRSRVLRPRQASKGVRVRVACRAAITSHRNAMPAVPGMKLH